MRFNDAVLGSVLIVFAAALATYSRTFPDIPGQQYGASVFPTLIALGLAGSGAMLVVSGLRQHAPLVVWADWARERHGVRNVVIVILLVIFYIVASRRLGFILTTALLLLALLLRFRVRWTTAVAIAIVIPVIMQYLFGNLLLVPLPWGLLAPIRWG